MHLLLHPKRREALTLNKTTLIRWSLANQLPSKLSEVSTAPYSLLDPMILQDGRIVFLGDVTYISHDDMIALKYTNPQGQKHSDPCVIELRHWENLSLATTIVIPQALGPLWSMAGSPNGRWLVVATGNPERLFLLEYQTGEVMSHHALWGCMTSGLTFDPTSTYVAGVSGHENWGHLMLWRLTPAKHWVPYTGKRSYMPDPEPDEVYGAYALELDHWELDRTGVAWPRYDLADTVGTVAFSPDSHLVVFRLISSYNTPFIDFVAYEVVSGKQQWHIQRKSEDGSGECFTFTPDGLHLLICGRDNNLYLYRTSDGILQQKVSLEFREPVEALAFDHDSTMLWLASEETLRLYSLREERCI